MTKKVMEGSHAIAEAAKLCEPGVVAAYPITPQIFNNLLFIE
jgi:pyruvate ferredoxin oxidoreductase alpha subunit